MDLDIDVYFWMVDRGVFDDDQRNKVDMEKNKVRLYREHAQKFENGLYVAKLLLILKKPLIGESQRQHGTVNKKFGIRVDGEKKAKIVEGRYQILCDVLNKLFDFDNGGGPNTSRILDVNTSEILYGDDLKDKSNLDITASPIKDDGTLSIDGRQNSLAYIKNAPIPKKGTLEPIESYKTMNSNKIGLTGNTTVIMSKDFSQISKGLPKMKNPLRLSNPEVFNEIDINKDLQDTESTLEFILLGLSKCLGINPKQAVGLLSNNHKYLIHIVVKGTKGGDFNKIQQWYSDLYANSKHLVMLIDKEKDQNSMSLTLNIIKTGLFSSLIDLVMICCRVLSKIGQDINQIGGQLSGLAWDWFIHESNTLGGQDINLFDITELGSPQLKNQQSLNVLGDSGLQACIYALKRHSMEFIEHIVPIMIQYGRNNYLELFTHHLKVYFSDKAQYMNLCHDILLLVVNISVGKQALISSLVLDNWIDLAIRQADYDGMNSPEERIAALAFLEETWELKSERIEDKTDVAQAVLTMLKRGCRDKSKILRIASCELMMKLLHIFAIDRNANAPILYKTLTFLLIEFHMDIEIREQMMRHYTTLYKQIQSIPVSILCEPLLKQIQISDTTSYHFNVFDFEFFDTVSKHKRLNVSIGTQIVEVMSKVAQSNIFFSNSAVKIMIQLLLRYSKDPSLHHTFSQIFKQALQTLSEFEKQRVQQEQDRKKLLIQHVRDEETILKNTINKFQLKRLQDQEKQKKIEQEQAFEAINLSRKTKEKLIVNMIQKLMLIGNSIMKQDLRMQLLNTYTRIEKLHKVKSKPISYLLSLFGESVPQMLQYFIEHELPNQEQQNEEFSYNIDNNSQQQIFKLDDLSQPDSSAKMELLPYEGRKTIKRNNKYQDKALREIEKIKNVKLEQTQRKILEEELKKVKDERQASMVKRKIEERKILHGVESKANRGKSEDKDGTSSNLLIIRPREIERPLAIEEDNQRLLAHGGSDKDLSIISGNSPFKKLVKKVHEVKLLDIRLEEQKDQDAVRFQVKKYIKIFKHLFNQYCFSGASQHQSKTFDEKQSKFTQMSVAEIIKMLKDYQITHLQVPKDDIMQIIRLINKEILKKSEKNLSSLLVLDLEGFVEFMLQIAVYIYSFEADMTPGEYLQRLIDHFKKVAKAKNLSTSKIFEDPDLATIGDTALISELNKRLSVNPDFQVPEGFSKFVEKEVVNVYKIPEYFPIEESQRIAIEILDDLFAEQLGFHFIEPMSEIKEVRKVRQNIKHASQDIFNEANIKRYMQAASKPRARSRANRDKLSTSLDVNPIQSSKNSHKPRGFTSNLSTPMIQNLEVKPLLNPSLKLEVAKAPARLRQHYLETAYVLEEILQAVEFDLDQLPPRKTSVRPKIVNKAIEEKRQKLEEDEKLRTLQQHRLEQRKKLLKEQLEKMKEVQSVKTKEIEQQKKQQTQAEKEKLKKKEEAKKQAFQQITKEMEQKRTQKEEEEKRKKEQEEQKKRSQSLDKQKEMKEQLKKKKQDMKDQFKKLTEERVQKQQKDEEDRKKQEELLKKKKEQANKIYSTQRQQVQEKMVQMKQECQDFKDSEEVRYLFSRYDRSLQQFFEQYCKFDKNQIGLMTYDAYKQMGAKTLINTQAITSQEFIYIYKTIMRDKIKQETQPADDNLESSKLNYMEFIEVMFKIACFGRNRLGGLKNNREDQSPSVEKSLSKNNSGGLKKLGTSNSQKNLGLGELSAEREYDIRNMTTVTIENLFKFLKMKPLKEIIDNNTLRGGVEEIQAMEGMEQME